MVRLHQSTLVCRDHPADLVAPCRQYPLCRPWLHQHHQYRVALVVLLVRYHQLDLEYLEVRSRHRHLVILVGLLVQSLHQHHQYRVALVVLLVRLHRQHHRLLRDLVVLFRLEYLVVLLVLYHQLDLEYLEVRLRHRHLVILVVLLVRLHRQRHQFLLVLAVQHRLEGLLVLYHRLVPVVQLRHRFLRDLEVLLVRLRHQHRQFLPGLVVLVGLLVRLHHRHQLSLAARCRQYLLYRLWLHQRHRFLLVLAVQHRPAVQSRHRHLVILADLEVQSLRQRLLDPVALLVLYHRSSPEVRYCQYLLYRLYRLWLHQRHRFLRDPVALLARYHR